MTFERKITEKRVKGLGISFGLFFAFSIFGLVALTGYLVGRSVVESETAAWRTQLAQRLDMIEERLRNLRDTAALFADNSYVSTSIIDVAGRASYLPQIIGDMSKARGVAFAGVFDFSGKPISVSSNFPEQNIDQNLLRYVIETGRERLWCDGMNKRVFVALPVNYYNTPQGALILVAPFADLDRNVDSEQERGGAVVGLCDKAVVLQRGDIPRIAHIDIEIPSVSTRQPLAAMMALSLRGTIALQHVLEPAWGVVTRLALWGFLFMIVGGLIARRIEREIISTRDLALQSSRARSQFLANMSHEIRTPLNGALGNINLLLEEPLTAEQRNLAADAKLSGQNLLELLNDILDFSKIDAGHMRLEMGSVAVRELVETVERSFHAVSREKGLSGTLSVAPSVPEFIRGDALRLRQILNNLLSNAIKFTSTGSVDISVSLDETGGFILFAVTDTGIGIPEGRIERLFSPFTQAEASTTRRFGGTGLGLSICRELARMMGGEVSVTSVLGKGSVFTLRIPLIQGTPDAVTKTVTTESAYQPTNGLRILLVEDNAVNRALVVKLLAKYKHQVDVASNGEEAVALVEKNIYDLVFMDCQMPVMDGYEATRAIRAKFSDGPRIVALTANAFKEDEQKCREAGMDDFLTKPVSREGLEKIMRSTLRRTA